jgi:hypothetical protein
MLSQEYLEFRTALTVSIADHFEQDQYRECVRRNWTACGHFRAVHPELQLDIDRGQTQNLFQLLPQLRIQPSISLAPDLPYCCPRYHRGRSLSIISYIGASLSPTTCIVVPRHLHQLGLPRSLLLVQLGVQHLPATRHIACWLSFNEISR